MTESPAPAVAAPSERSRALVDRALAAFPLASILVWSVLLYCFETAGRTSPTLFTDELEWSQLSRAIAATGQAARRGVPFSPKSVYSYLIAPAWLLGDTSHAYGAARYLTVLATALAPIPAYLLARRLVSKPGALFVAAATACVPSTAYGLYLIPEGPAYAYSTLCAFLIAGALAVRRRRWIAAAIVAALCAPLVRGELLVVPVAFAIAAAALWWVGPHGRELRRSWSRLDRVGVALLAVAVFFFLNRLLLGGVTSWSVTTEFYRGRIFDNLVWAFGATAIGVGVLPLVAALASWPRRGERLTPWERALCALLPAWLFAFGLYTAVKAAYLSTVFATRVTERNLFYVAPLLFLATAVALERRRVRLLPLAAAVAVTGYLLASTPLQLDYPYFEALGFSILAFANRNLYMGVDALRTGLWVVLGVGGAVLLVAWAAPGRVLAGRARAAATGALALVGTAVVLWNLLGQVAAADASDAASRQLLANFHHPPNWIDRETGGAGVTYLGQQLGFDTNGVDLLEFWNRSIRHVWSLDGTAPGPGPTLSPDLASSRGTLTPSPGTPYLLADNGVDPVGRPISTWGTVRLYRLHGPIRLADWVSGIFSDGWISASATYVRFATPGDRPGLASVTLSRANFCPDPSLHAPRTVATVRVGPMRIVNGQPTLWRVTATRRVRLANCAKPVDVQVPVAPPPWQVDVAVSPTVRPSDYGMPDGRELGAQVLGFDFVARRRG